MTAASQGTTSARSKNSATPTKNAQQNTTPDTNTDQATTAVDDDLLNAGLSNPMAALDIIIKGMDDKSINAPKKATYKQLAMFVKRHLSQGATSAIQPAGSTMPELTYQSMKGLLQEKFQEQESRL